jgi:hypothetical protein
MVDWRMTVEIELGRTHRRWRVSNAALAMTGWGHISTIAMLSEAPYDPGR